ncbi:MAG: flagellar biosynthesis protein FlhB [Dehalococcoidia bacterium]|nr:MAG: flagellar biosynthesis protein FlhB [Dehalococcoidia bacterium]
MAGERTEAPTAKRVSDARKRGQVAHSREMDTALAALASVAVLKMAGAAMWRNVESMATGTWMFAGEAPLTVELTAESGTALIWQAVTILAPLLGVLATVAVLGAWLQTGGPLFSTEAVKPQFKRLDPVAGARRMGASRQAWVALAKSVAKFAVLGIVAWITLRSRWDGLIALGLSGDLRGAVGGLVSIAFDLALRVALVLSAIGAADFLFQRMEWMRELRMSRDDLKDELKQTDGDPQVKGQLARARRSLMSRVMQNVPKADVVIVNPTHYAVALKYDPATSRAPVLLAKGADLIAFRIREVAQEHGITVIENPPLCRAVYQAVRVGQEIPPALYEAVAEVLAFVYRVRSGLRRVTA